MTDKLWERRDVLRFCIHFCAIGGSLALLDACAPGQYFAIAEESDGKLAVKKTEFESTTEGGPGRSFLLVRGSNLNFPIIVNRRADSTYAAILLRCTHQGCEVAIEGQGLACPCHGSEFSLAGEVTRGPAERNLHSFRTTEDDEHVYIWLR